MNQSVSGSYDGARVYRVLRDMSVGMAASALLVMPALAEVPTPRIKPPNAMATQRLLSPADFRVFKSGLAAGNAGRWAQQDRYQNQLTDILAKNILAWQRASRDPNAPYATLDHVVQNLSDWPREVTVRAKAEDELLAKRMPSDRVISWFGEDEPVSGEGRIALARAYFIRGDEANGLKYLRLGWRESKLTRDVQRTVFKEFQSKLTPADHAARADHLIWQGRRHFDKVQGLLPLMDKGERALIEARMALIGRKPNVTAKINAVPAALRDRPELHFERARWRRKKLSRATAKDKALEAMLEITAPVASEAARDDVWREKRLLAYWLIGEKRYAEAYRMTQHHGLTKGSAFAEAQFLGGWLSLRYLGEAARAEQHFQELYNGVSLPVSKARGAYWMGRALEVQGKDSTPYYQAAAAYPNTYYGQLATHKLGGTNQLTLPVDPGAPESTDIRMRAMQMLAEANEERLMQAFSYHMDDEVQTLAELAKISQMGAQFDHMRMSVRAAKQAGRFGTLLTEVGYPMPVSITSLDAGKYDVPFTLAIARQESEFQANSVSSAKAYGMMQMIDATAKATARKHGLRYDRSRMLGDEYYAARMGSLHLNDLLQRYDGSYIMSAAAYNAGPTRVSQWVKRFGDPRTGAIDPIDWIESIPFSETRNYVQRVMENMQVYHARMNGNRARNQIVSAISVGAY